MLAHNFRDGPFVGSSSGSLFYPGFQSPHHFDDSSHSLSGSIPSPGFFPQEDQVSGSLSQQPLLHQMPHHIHHGGVASDLSSPVHGSPVKSPVHYGSYGHHNGHQHPHLLQQSHQVDQRSRPSETTPSFFVEQKILTSDHSISDSILPDNQSYFNQSQSHWGLHQGSHVPRQLHVDHNSPHHGQTSYEHHHQHHYSYSSL
jgi:hypothetical protein